MKTFTLRLTDIEAEALERLAALRKVSKNQVIKDVIVEEYCNYDIAATYIDNELDTISALQSFAQSVDQSDYSGATAVYTLRAAQYVKESYEGNSDIYPEEVKAIEEYIEKIKEEVRDEEA